MKRFFSTVFPLVALATQTVFSQDPGFLPAEPARRPAAPAAPAPPPASTRDDTAAAVAQMSSMNRLNDTYKLNNRDIVSLRIVEDTATRQAFSLKIQDSGDINAPFIGLIPAAGRTCKQVAFEMKRELEKEHFRVATVVMALEEKYVDPNARKGGGGMQPEFRANYITIFGQVMRQGKYEMDPDEDLTVSQAILRAGGFSQFAEDRKVKVIRKVPGKGNVTIYVNLKDVMMRGKLEFDIPIRGGDVIVVAEKLVNI